MYESKYGPLSTRGKAVLIVLDGVGIGELPDAPAYGDGGSNTLVNTATAVGGFSLPHLASLGLGAIVPIPGVPAASAPRASYGKMAELSKGKDSTTGHWELTGVVVDREFPTFPNGFPEELLDRFLRITGTCGYLGNTTASGTVIIQELGNEHRKTGYPIIYTSADSVFQIAAHEEVIPLPALYEMCRRTRESVCTGKFAVGRVIARPFVGAGGNFIRTTNRRDFSLEPFSSTLLDVLSSAGVPTVGVGKIDDLFARRGLSRMIHTRTNVEGVQCLKAEARELRHGFLMANLGDFDTLYGHRNDPKGFAAALEEFDREIPGILETLIAGDLLILTADHGNDPVTPSTDHSREYVPLLCFTPGRHVGNNLGTRRSFADAGKTVAAWLGVDNSLAGESFMSSLVQ